MAWNVLVDGDGSFALPAEAMAVQGWNAGDVIEFEVIDGSIRIRRVDESPEQQ